MENYYMQNIGHVMGAKIETDISATYMRSVRTYLIHIIVKNKTVKDI